MKYQYLKEGVDDNLEEIERWKKIKYTVRRMYMQTVDINKYNEIKEHLKNIDDKRKELKQNK